MQHFIYKTTCTVTGKFYLGMHSGREDDGYLGSGIKLKNSVRKYGRENHVREILAKCIDRETLSKLEAAMITEEVIKDPKCMNLIPGGKGGFHAHRPESKAKMRDIAANRPASHYVQGERHGMFGKTHTPEVRERIAAAARKPKAPFSEEHRKKISDQVKRIHAERRAARGG